MGRRFMLDKLYQTWFPSVKERWPTFKIISSYQAEVYN
jgi:hypothetical protein